MIFYFIVRLQFYCCSKKSSVRSFRCSSSQCKFTLGFAVRLQAPSRHSTLRYQTYTGWHPIRDAVGQSPSEAALLCSAFYNQRSDILNYSLFIIHSSLTSNVSDFISGAFAERLHFFIKKGNPRSRLPAQAPLLPFAKKTIREPPTRVPYEKQSTGLFFYLPAFFER